MKMTPLFLEILFHFYAPRRDYEREQAPACQEVIRHLLSTRLIEKSSSGDEKYFMTLKGDCYTETILRAADSVTLPYWTCDRLEEIEITTQGGDQEIVLVE